jgi:hypothetical protein
VLSPLQLQEEKKEEEEKREIPEKERVGHSHRYWVQDLLGSCPRRRHWKLRASTMKGIV